MTNNLELDLITIISLLFTTNINNIKRTNINYLLNHIAKTSGLRRGGLRSTFFFKKIVTKKVKKRIIIFP